MLNNVILLHYNTAYYPIISRSSVQLFIPSFLSHCILVSVTSFCLTSRKHLFSLLILCFCLMSPSIYQEFCKVSVSIFSRTPASCDYLGTYSCLTAYFFSVRSFALPLVKYVTCSHLRTFFRLMYNILRNIHQLFSSFH